MKGQQNGAGIIQNIRSLHRYPFMMEARTAEHQFMLSDGTAFPAHMLPQSKERMVFRHQIFQHALAELMPGGAKKLFRRGIGKTQSVFWPQFQHRHRQTVQQ